ncbi:Alpha carbonic anhydrase 4 [Hibiscus syriacus]|uniref:Alpha carbonic anhydrase 4 n=1 Tax=Hibiscus syriacus TaxID=106335 RepID=A0A6A2ZSM8_HIBSY|nr:Alpha carbonic anhydrase 4 [Hibiscus syriacus]
MEWIRSITFPTLLISSLCFFLLIAIASSDEVEDETVFTYIEGTGKGPKEWGQLDPHWKLCETGKFQSPIDVPNGKLRVVPSLGKLKKNYKPVPAVLKNRGHDIKIRWDGDAGKITVNGTDYKLIQCHWHSPSEHTFNGTRYQMELHMVHRSASGEMAVISVFYKYGRPDPFLTKLFHDIKTVGEEEENLGIINPRDIKFNGRKYFRYIGSLTVPPCTEGVVWTLIQKGFETNIRPTQPLDGRTVLFYAP